MRKKGFTLLELLIVIIIIGLLAAIGITQYANAVRNAKRAQAKATLGEMRKAALGYRSISGNWPTLTQMVSIDLDGDTNSDLGFTPPTGGGIVYSANSGAGTGSAVIAGDTTVTITFSTGVITY